jgi:hypothetical protein
MLKKLIVITFTLAVCTSAFSSGVYPQQTTPVPRGRVKKFRGVLPVGNSGVAFDSPQCGQAIELAVRSGHAGPAPSDFCAKSMTQALVLMHEAAVSAQAAPANPAAKNTPSVTGP